MVLKLRPRYREILKAVNDHQVLDINQVQMMFFKSYSRACYRVAQLVSAGFLVERYVSQVSTSPLGSLRVLTLGTAGRRVLADTFGYTSSDIYRAGKQLKNPETINHLLAINRIIAPIYRTCADDPAVELVQWRGERESRSKPDQVNFGDEKKPILKPVYPDGFIHLLADMNHNFFIEADNATESLKQVKSQMKIHEEFY